jgi:hypothetical protein
MQMRVVFNGRGLTGEFKASVRVVADTRHRKQLVIDENRRDGHLVTGECAGFVRTNDGNRT